MKLIFTLFLCFIFIAASSNCAEDLNIIPKPVSEITTNEKYILQNGSYIFINSNDKELKSLAALLKDNLHKRSGINVFIRKGRANNGIFLEVNKKSSISPEGYELTITNKTIRLSSKSCTGIFYGIQTLNEILRKDSVLYFPGCKVIDYPKYSYRGFMLDASRHFQSIQFVKKILDMMAQLKLNTFHWHLTDDEGWRIESKKYPSLNEIGSYLDSLNALERNGYYTVEDIKEVIQYAKNRYIKVIPEIEMPGHSKAVMDSYPHLLCPTDSVGKTYCAGNKETYKFIKNVISEIIAIFNPEIIHVGGDERPKGIWEECPKCKEMTTLKNLANEDMLQNYFMNEICKFISGKGVKTLAWAENIKGGVPQNQIVEGWHPGESWEAARNGYYTVNADNIYVYFDYPHSIEEKKTKPEWMPILNLEKVYSFNPTPDSLKENEKKFVIGSECALWTELVLENNIQHQIFPRILAFAEVVWSLDENKNYENFLTRVNALKPFINLKGFEFDKGE
jgi:hexosaminidase